MAGQQFDIVLTNGGNELATGLPDSVYTVSIKTATGTTATVAAGATAYLIIDVTEGATNSTRHLVITGAETTGTQYGDTLTPIGYFTSSETTVSAGTATLYGATFS
ncbi:MAG: hypothetical protein Q4G58_14640 [bacterium]|nr:hypothetical protein [bacterium]